MERGLRPPIRLLGDLVSRIVDADFWLMSARHLSRFRNRPIGPTDEDLSKIKRGDVVQFMTSDSPYYTRTGILRPAESGTAEVLDVSVAHRRLLAKISCGMVQTSKHKLRHLMVIKVSFDYVTGLIPQGDDYA